MAATILCVDRDRNYSRIVARALEAGGFETLVAHDPEDALRLVRSDAPDLALLEVMLPRRSGFELLAAIRSLGGAHASMPALFLTSAACSPAWKERAQSLRAAALLKKPVALDELLTRVESLIAPAAAPEAAPSAPPRPAATEAHSPTRYRVGRSAELAGALEDLPFPALLHHVHGLRASGVLHLRSQDKRKWIELREGRPTAVRSNLINERLGNLLVRWGKISGAVLAESTRRLRTGEAALQGEILVSMRALDEAAVVEALRRQAFEKLLEIFTWRAGRFELQLGARLEKASKLVIRESPANAILAGIRSHMPLDRIDALLAARGPGEIFPGESAFYSFQDVELTDDERSLIEQCRKGRDVSSLIEGDPTMRRALYALLETGMVEHRASSPPSSPDRDAPTPPSPAARARPAPAAAEATAEDHSHYAADHQQRVELTRLIERLADASPFQKLGVATSAAPEEIRRAYAQLAKHTHPDRYAGSSEAVRELAEQAFHEITNAYEALSDPQGLAAYRADPQRDRRQAEEIEEGYRALQAEQHFQKGEARLRGRDWGGALACFERAVELYPDEGEYHAYAGWAYYLTHGQERDVMERAFEIVKRGAKLAPDREKPYLFLGRLYLAVERLGAAERMFTRAIECRPDSVEAMRELRLLEMRRPKRSSLKRLFTLGRRRRDTG